MRFERRQLLRILSFAFGSPASPASMTPREIPSNSGNPQTPTPPTSRFFPDFVLDELLLLVYSSYWICTRLNFVAPASCRRFCSLSNAALRPVRFRRATLTLLFATPTGA
jgi:hypothetical protein